MLQEIMHSFKKNPDTVGLFSFFIFYTNDAQQGTNFDL